MNHPMQKKSDNTKAMSRRVMNQGMYAQLAKSVVELNPSLDDTEKSILSSLVSCLGEAIELGHTSLHLSQVMILDSQCFFDSLNDSSDGYRDRASDLIISCCQKASYVWVLDQKLENQEALKKIQQELQTLNPMFVLYDGVFYLAKHFYIELGLLITLIERSQQDVVHQDAFNQDKSGQDLDLSTRPTSISDEIDWQNVAVKNTLLTRLSIIVGGPGTGKTTTVAKIVEQLLLPQGVDICEKVLPKLNIAMAAPTGKAAARLHSSLMKNLKQRLERYDVLDFDLWQHCSQSLPESGLTLHRLLGFMAGQASYRFDANHQLALDCLIVDEVSMIDLHQFYYLLRAIPKSCRVILLGDPKQLASVESGSVLADLCHESSLNFYTQERASLLGLSQEFSLDSNRASPRLINNISYLRKSYRFDEHSGIGYLAKACLSGDTQSVLKADDPDISWINPDHFNDYQNFLLQAVSQHQHVVSVNSFDKAFAELSKFQILTVSREGPYSIEDINDTLLELIKRTQASFLVGEFEIYHGLPIIIEKNLYDKNLFNGDIGLCWIEDDLKQKEKPPKVTFVFEQDGGYVQYYPQSISGWRPAHAITVHKSQGSEYDCVALVLPELLTGSLPGSLNSSSHPLLSRELLYTAITRAKKSFIGVGQQAAIEYSVAQKESRFSNLGQMLSQL